MADTRPKPKALVVDDEPTIADTLALILSLQGYETAPVYCGREALEMARQVRPDLIISDVFMPDMNGVEAMILIRSFLPDCKILLISTEAAAADLLESAKARGHEFEVLIKPIHPKELLAKLAESTAA